MSTYRPRDGALLSAAVMTLCVVAWIGSVFALFPAPASPKPPGWPDGLLVLCMAASAGLSLSRSLPVQNIAVVVALALAVAAGAFGGFILGLFPGARLVFGNSLGPVLGGRVPWMVLLVWVVVLLTSRGVAVLVVRPARGQGRYGHWLMTVTALLAAGLGAGAEWLASQVKHYWRWECGAAWATWNGLFWPAPALWLIAALAFHLAALPWLVSKRPGHPPTDWHPLILWCLVHLWIIAGTSTRGWLGPAAWVLALALITLGLAARGGVRGQQPSSHG
jgi:hypothetical protein